MKKFVRNTKKYTRLLDKFFTQELFWINHKEYISLINLCLTMKKKNLYHSFIIFFGIIFMSLLNTDCERISPNKAAVELSHIDKLPIESKVFYDKKKVDYKLLLDKEEMTAALFLLEKNDEIPLHFHQTNKAAYIFKGQIEMWANNQSITANQGDSVFIPKQSVTRIKNNQDELAKVFLFFPTGFFQSLPFQSPKQQSDLDKQGKKIRLIQEASVSWENWDGKLPSKDASPLAWKTLIDDESMVLGITKIDSSHDVDSHYHKQTQIIIFSDGEGKTHIADGVYKEVKKLSYIYPPSYSIHHSINTSKTEPLLEIYFFPTGPFSTVKYLFTK